MFTGFLKKSHNAKGASLLMVMLVAAGVVALSVIVMNNNRAKTKAVARQSADVEVEMAINKLTAQLNSANHCNAVFHGRNIPAITFVPNANPNLESGTYLTGHIQTCSTAACTYGTGVNTYAIGQTSWDGSVTGFPIGAKVAGTDFVGVSSRIRIWSAKVSIDTSYHVPSPSPSGDMMPWTARMSVRIEKNLMQRNPDGTKLTTNEFRNIYFPVTLSDKNVAINSTTILGCPKVATTTILP